MMRNVLIALMVMGVAAGCANRNDNRIAFDGAYFKTKAKRVGDDWAEFTIEVKGVSASLDGAREAAKYEATKYCIENDGTSRIRWSYGPDTEASQLVISDDTLVFQGRCDP